MQQRARFEELHALTTSIQVHAHLLFVATNHWSIVKGLLQLVCSCIQHIEDEPANIDEDIALQMGIDDFSARPTLHLALYHSASHAGA